MKGKVNYRTAGGSTVTWKKNPEFMHDFGPAECGGCGWTRGHVAPESAQVHANRCTAY
ncbi:hypothetical protein ABZW11_17305 [Nonomuraea sp. NPDC004580]|uniref:hypothetical protein n=1 Tax=Nonomuraea sp. NPDC004580 TaxID=3154552 RepID=UPI0033BAD669